MIQFRFFLIAYLSEREVENSSGSQTHSKAGMGNSLRSLRHLGSRSAPLPAEVSLIGVRAIRQINLFEILNPHHQGGVVSIQSDSSNPPLPIQTAQDAIELGRGGMRFIT